MCLGLGLRGAGLCSFWAGRLCVCGLLAGAARGVWVVGALGPSGLLSPLLGSKKKKSTRSNTNPQRMRLPSG